MAEGDAKRWFKYGCFGCLGVVGLVVVLAAIALGTAWMRARSEKVESRALSHAAPAAATLPAPTPQGPAPTPAAGARGRVVLDLNGAEFHVRPGAAGEPIRVEATYDTASYVLEEFTEDAADGTWTYRVEFRRLGASSGFGDVLRRIFSKSRPSVTVILPRELPIALEATVEQGGLEGELGGLHLTSAVVHASMGGVEIRVSEPLARPMDRLEIRTSMGGGSFRSVGNASPRVLDVEYSMGGMDLDLTGAWAADSAISLRGSMGGAHVRLPRDVRVEGVPASAFAPPPTGELRVPLLRFEASSAMGDVKFD